MHLRNGAASEGILVVCECVVAGIFPIINDRTLFAEFFKDWQFEYSVIIFNGALLADICVTISLHSFSGTRAKPRPSGNERIRRAFLVDCVNPPVMITADVSKRED